jgi:hypothetical protein
MATSLKRERRDCGPRTIHQEQRPHYEPPSFAKDAVEGRQQRLTDVGGEREFADKLLQ